MYLGANCYQRACFSERSRWRFGVVGCVAQLAERRSLAGELTLSCDRPLADG